MVDLAIVGPGVLGSLVAEQYKDSNASSTIALVFRLEDDEAQDKVRCNFKLDDEMLSKIGKFCNICQIGE